MPRPQLPQPHGRTAAPGEAGAAAESIAAAYLAERGYQLIARNYKTRLGEVDLIVEKGIALVFVEVRSRSSMVVAPEETVIGGKRRRISLAALEFASTHGLMNRAIRFDIVSVLQGERGTRIEHFPDAFEVSLPASPPLFW